MGTKTSIDDVFTADSTGYFRVKFIKRTGHENVKYYDIGVCNAVGRGRSFPASDIKTSNKTFQIDTIKFVPL